MPGLATSARERVEAATREAHLRVIVETLNNWLLDPNNPSKRKKLSRMLGKYQSAAGRHFPVSPFPVLARHGAGALPFGEMKEALELIRQAKQEQESPPWD